MRPSIVPTILPRMAPIALLAAVTLAGCATADGAQQASASAPAARAAPAHAARSAGQDAQAAASHDEWWQEGGVTRTKINAMCWMKYEKGRNDLPLDTRADLVNRCVGEALKRYHME
jgi:hypothetical protein